MIKEITCISCPNGCEMSVEVVENKIIRVENNKCERGISFANEEIFNPQRMLCSTVKTSDPKNLRLPVRTDKVIPKNKIFEAMKCINNIVINKNIQMGEKIIENLLGLGVSIIASQSLKINSNNV
ncbi:DUF1667 domain-containing protein [Clostridiaceae bacterium HSG29]|nr:DUF1667 domain-containing protein [Clostridiaceae bacterium HSG29]